jgi:hypothetical protein
VQTDLVFLLVRLVERLAAVAIGAFAIWLGFQLFLAMPALPVGESKVSLPGGVSIYLSRIGPGVFFALFGTGLIGYTVSRTTTLKQSVDGDKRTQDINFAIPGRRPPPGAPPESPAALGLPTERIVAGLAGLADTLQTQPNDPVRILRERSLRDARARVMLLDWKPEWGEPAEFREWIFQRGAEGPPPAEAVRAASVYGGGA